MAALPAITDARLNAIFGAGLTELSGIGASLPSPIGRTINILADNWNIDNSNTGIVTLGILLSVVDIAQTAGTNMVGVIITPATPNVITWEANTDIGALTCGNADLASNNLAGITNDAAGNFFRSVITSSTNAKKWILDLVGAYQVRALSSDNIISYFQGAGIERINGSSLLSIIAPLSKIIPVIVVDNGARSRMSNIDWVRYHTSATSTPVLVQRAIDFVGNSIPNFWAANTITAVTNALNAPWDKGLADLIPKKAVAASHALLTALKQCPRDWYQGNKAKSTTPASTYAAWLSVASKLQELIVDQNAINNAVSSAALSNVVPGACLNC